MTAQPSLPRLSPMAGLINALARHAIHRLAARCAELEAELLIATATNQQLKGGAS